MTNSFDDLTRLSKLYLDSKDEFDENNNPELEIKFGTRKLKNINNINKINYDNVIKMLKSYDFICDDIGKQYLNVSPDLSNKNIRIQINGLSNIQKYCMTNNINDENGNIFDDIIIMNKELIQYEDIINPVNIDSFNFRASYNNEEILVSDDEVNKIVSELKNVKKFYRLIKRFTFTNEEYPFNVDLSIVKESKNKFYNIKESEIFQGNEKYEIEIEFDNNKINSDSDLKEIDSKLKKIIKIILSGLQETKYPISYEEQNIIANNYLSIVKKDEKYNKPILPRDFIGPSSYTLQMSNISEKNDDAKIPNIRNMYTVTDKADGDRKLLFVNNKGKIYLITTNMIIQYTGAETNNKELYNSILDGEHILYNKKGQFINLYAAFDIYFINNKDVRSLGFTPLSIEDIQNNFRLPLLNKFIKNLEAVLVGSKNKLPPIRIEGKKFYAENDKQTIFVGCNTILSQVNNDFYEYNTDGLIFTPMDKGVGSDKIGEEAKSYKITWDYSFKWKPAIYNTIDFLVTTKKMPNGQEYIGNMFQSGTNTLSNNQINQYKTLILRVGFDIKKHGYINPCVNIIEDVFPSNTNIDDEDGYKPVQFFPTNPYDNDAGVCNILLSYDNLNVKQMFTEENEIIEDNMIVEFRYDVTREKQWRWIPLRVRYDKTADFRAGNKNFGNAYHVANSNWHSIHNPITESMISTGKNIENELGDDDIYYNKIEGVSITRPLRDFHNLFVKNILVSSVSKKGDSLIDYAMGKGGDLPKWIYSNLSFVFGMDISRDNIENKIDGACARYINYRKKFKVLPKVMFIQGNAALNIKKLQAQYTDKGKQITEAIFGNGPKDEKTLGKGVYNIYGKGDGGFNISSIQFALHYMFESNTLLQNFLTNLSECTALNGIVIGTCFDGKKIFELLKDKKDNESFIIMKDDKKITQITKKYDFGTFENNISSIGYGIEVYQESINKVFKEYLVNFDYFHQLMEDYGFAKLTEDELKRIELPSSVGSFEILYNKMLDEIEKNPRKKNNYGSALKMSDEEKIISFANNYFIYKKVRNIDIVDANNILTNETEEQKKEEYVETLKSKKVIEEEKNNLEGQTIKTKPKKIKKLKLES